VNTLVVHAHPNPQSYSASLFRLAVSTLAAAGHHVETIDLYAEGFNPVMTREEREAYVDCPDWLVENFADHIAKLKTSEHLVLVYPTWWNGLPAMLKGWFDRVWLPKITFEPARRKGEMAASHLRHIRRFTVITHGGSPGWWLALTGHPHRNTMMRGLRVLFSLTCRARWLQLHDMNNVTPRDLTRFQNRVEKTLSRP
jgi:putative NADPH-quinone reductase